MSLFSVRRRRTLDVTFNSAEDFEAVYHNLKTLLKKKC